MAVKQATSTSCSVSNRAFHALQPLLNLALCIASICWLHDRNVTHCDIKVANLLVDTSQDKIRGHPILVDFGFATLHDEKTNFKSKQTWGTP